MSSAERPLEGGRDSRCGWPRFSFSVADNASDDQIGLVHNGAERYRKRISELTAFMNCPGYLGIDMAELVSQFLRDAYPRTLGSHP
jgi:hypothetical protein